jgi:hypothetical protein
MFNLALIVIVGFILYLLFDVIFMVCIAVVVLVLSENHYLPSLRGHELLYIVAIAILLSLKKN